MVSTNSSPIVNTLSENPLSPQRITMPSKPKSLISPKNKKRLRADIKEYETLIDDMHESLIGSSLKKKKKTHSKEERMELAQQAINSGNIKNFSEVNGIPYSTLNAWTKKFKALSQNTNMSSIPTPDLNKCLDDEDFFSSQISDSSQIEVQPQTPPKEEWLRKVSSTPVKDIQVAPLKNTITKHTGSSKHVHF